MGKVDVPVSFDNDETATWYCAYCNEDVVHQHRLKKPTYDDLVSKLRDLEIRFSRQHAQSRQWFEPIPRESWIDLRNLLERVDKGR